MTAAPRSRYLALSTGLTYHVLEWPHPESRTTVVLVHGFLDLAWGWRWVAEHLARDYHVIAPDLRGHGDSDWIGSGGYYYFFDYLADLDSLLPRVCRERTVLVGHSMGGSVASYYTGARAGRGGVQPAALALLEGLGPPETVELAPDGQARRVASWMEQWRKVRTQQPRPVATVEQAAARLRHHDPLLGEAQALELARLGTRPVRGGLAWKHDPLHVTYGPLPFRRQLAAELWSQVTCPVLIVDATASTLRLPEPEAALRRASFARAEHVLLDDAGHMMQRHQPAALAERLRAFVGAL